MSLSRSSNLSRVASDEPTPKPASAVHAVERSAEPPQRGIEQRAAFLEYFANPSPEMGEMDAAWEEALELYGDEDSDAWVSALENGTHPLCRVQMPNRSA